MKLALADAAIELPASNALDGRWIAARPWLRWTFGFGLPIACFALALIPTGFLPTDLWWPRPAVLAWAATSLAAMALSTQRRSCGAMPMPVLAGLLAGGALFACVHTVVLIGPILGALLYAWIFLPLALAPPAAVLVYAACAGDELSRARPLSLATRRRFFAGLALPIAAAAGATGAVRGTEAVLLARLVEPEAVLDASDLAPLRAIGWLDHWEALQDVRRTWLHEEPPAYGGRALRARQVLHALTGDFDGPPPGSADLSARD